MREYWRKCNDIEFRFHPREVKVYNEDAHLISNNRHAMWPLLVCSPPDITSEYFLIFHRVFPAHWSMVKVFFFTNGILYVGLSNCLSGIYNCILIDRMCKPESIIFDALVWFLQLENTGERIVFWWPNTNTNIIRFPKNDRIRRRILFGFSKTTEYEYEYYSANQKWQITNIIRLPNDDRIQISFYFPKMIKFY